VNLLETIRGLKVVPRFLVIGTSEEYGLVYPDELPIKETNPLRPLSPYAVSKVTQDMMGFQYFRSYGFPIIRTRAFNHDWMLLEHGEPGEVYNLCSGRSWVIQEVLDFFLDQATRKGIAVEVDPARLRPSDVMILEGDSSKIREAVGWEVEIPFERTLKDLLAHRRQRISAT
jgi:GDP-4-dehydro-6-deoxy-D-mannose reductase